MAFQSYRRKPKYGPSQVRETEASGYILRRPKYARARERTSKGAAIGNSFAIRFVVETELAYNFDQRVRVEFIAEALAQHYSDSLLAGRKPDAGPQPEVTDEVKQADSLAGVTRRNDTVGARTGWLAEHWQLLATRGHRLNASKTIKPNGGGPPLARSIGPRSYVINAMLDRGIDLQSVTGEAARVIEAADDEWLAGAVGRPEDLHDAPHLQASTLDKLRRWLG